MDREIGQYAGGDRRVSPWQITRWTCDRAAPTGCVCAHRRGQSIGSAANAEVREPERLVFTFAWEDKEGRPGHETIVTVNFAEYGAQTELTLHQAVFETVTARDLHQGGWASALECLAEYLAQARLTALG